jgi:hypothetical protein
MIPDFPQSPAQVLEVIAKAERSRKFVWTAGRVVKEAALSSRLMELSFEERRAVLLRVTNFLEDLARQETLQRRPVLQSIGFGNEIGFDYMQPPLT